MGLEGMGRDEMGPQGRDGRERRGGE